MWCTQPPRQQTQAADKFTLKLINRYEIVCASCKHIGRHTGSTCTRHNTLTLTLDVMLSAVSSRSHVNSIQRTVSPSNYFIFSSVHLVCVCLYSILCVCVCRLFQTLARTHPAQTYLLHMHVWYTTYDRMPFETAVSFTVASLRYHATYRSYEIVSVFALYLINIYENSVCFWYIWIFCWF